MEYIKIIILTSDTANNTIVAKGYLCTYSTTTSYHGDSVNIEQVVILSSLLLALHVPVKPPMNRILLSLIWTDAPSKYS